MIDYFAIPDLTKYKARDNIVKPGCITDENDTRKAVNLAEWKQSNFIYPEHNYQISESGDF